MSEQKQSGGSFLKVFTGTTLGVIVGIVLLFCICSSVCLGLAYIGSQNTPTKVNTDTNTTSNAPAPTPTPVSKQQFYIGDTVNSDGINLTVNSLSDFTSDNQYLQPASGNKYVVVDVTVENVSAVTSGYGNSFYFQLKDGDGYTYDSAFGGKDPSIKSDDIAQGEKTRGFITFEVPTTQSKFTLTYDPTLFGSAVVVNLVTK